MSTPTEREFDSCQGTKEDGTPCEVPGHLVDPETGYCRAHGPGGSEEMSKLGEKGGSRSSLETLKQEISTTLDPEDLPPLQEHRDAEIWLETVGRAVATGQLEERRAQACIRAVSKWIEARGERLTAEQIEELEARIEDVTEQLEEEASEPWA